MDNVFSSIKIKVVIAFRIQRYCKTESRAVQNSCDLLLSVGGFLIMTNVFLYFRGPHGILRLDRDRGTVVDLLYLLLHF